MHQAQIEQALAGEILVEEHHLIGSKSTVQHLEGQFNPGRTQLATSNERDFYGVSTIKEVAIDLFRKFPNLFLQVWLSLQF